MGSYIPEISQEYDFIIVGGGTAGNVVAGRLAENPNVSVLIIEAGKKTTNEIPEITTPARAFSLRNSEYDWGYKATMINRPDYERIEKPHTRGKILGGCSCLNYFTWVRGSRGTYDDWEEYGGPKWNWTNCKEYFDKPATYHDDSTLYNPVLSKVGKSGPLNVAISDMVPELEPFRQALTKAWVSKGQKLTEDIYSGEVNGLVKCMNTIYRGVRSNSTCFLTGKSNITILATSHAKKLVMEGTTATGVVVLGLDGTEHTFKATKEIIVSCGVFETPKLLMLSGIGPKDQLSQFNIPTVIESPHVGQNLLDHPVLPHVFQLKEGLGLDNHLLRAGPMNDAAISAYRKDHRGPYHSGLLELVGFPRIDDYLNTSREYVLAKAANKGIDPFGPAGQPHFEIDFVPMFGDAFQWHIPTPATGDHLTVIVDLLRPVSKPGEIRLRSGSAADQPYINLNFFASDLDVIAMREGIRFVDNILMNGDGMKDIIGSDYPWPMPRASDEAMNRMILERSQTGFHPCGTARLSTSIDQGVIDGSLKVHGAKNLRVIDASVFPVIPDCRIQNVVYMVAEKGADLIKASYPELY